MNILVTGATGHLGRAVVETLHTRHPKHQVNALVRTASKQELLPTGLRVHLGDYDNLPTLQKAMKGVDTVLLISAGDQGDRMQQHKNVIDAAIFAGVKRVAYTSRSLHDRSSLSNQLMLEHFQTEDYIKNSGMQYTLFQNALYMDVIPLFAGNDVLEKGIFQPAGNGKVAYALRAEMGEAMANVLVEPAPDNQVFRFTGSDACSFYDVASELTALSGKQVKYNPVEIEAFADMMHGKGLPPAMVKKIIDFNTDIKNGQEADVYPDLETKLRRKPASLKEGLKRLFRL